LHRGAPFRVYCENLSEFDQLRDKESVGMVDMGEECNHSAIDFKLADGEGGEGEVFVIFEKFVDVIFVFLGQDGAGGVNERAADLEIILNVFKNIVLYIWQAFALFGVFIAYLGLFADNSKA
jgi:hypothetical protein